MKYIVTIIVFIFSLTGFAQVHKVDAVDLSELTTTKINSLTSVPGGRLLYNVTTKTLWQYRDGAWVDLGSGGSDGNDFVTGGSVTGENLNLVIPNQTNPVIDLSDFALDTDIQTYTAGTGIGIDGSNSISIIPSYVAKLDGLQDSLDMKANVSDLQNYGWGTPVDNNILPDTDQTYDIGNLNSVFSKIYANEFYGSFFGGATFNALESSYNNFTGQTSDLSGFNPNNGVVFYNQTDKRLKMLFDNQIKTFAFADELSTGGTDDQTAAEVSYDNATSGLTATNTQDAIDEVVSESISYNISSSNPISTDTHQIVAANRSSNQKSVLNLMTNISGATLSAPASPSIGDQYRFVQDNAGPVKTDFYVRLSSVVSDTALVKTINIGDNIVFEYLSTPYPRVTGSYEVYTPPVEINAYDLANAANKDNEVDDTVGWVNDAGTTIASLAITPSLGSGSYAIELTAQDGNNDRAFANVTVESGEIYDYEILARQTVGTKAGWNLWSGVVTTPYNASISSTWTVYTGAVTTNATTLGIRLYPALGASGGAIGDKLQIGYIKLVKR